MFFWKKCLKLPSSTVPTETISLNFRKQFILIVDPCCTTSLNSLSNFQKATNIVFLITAVILIREHNIHLIMTCVTKLLFNFYSCLVGKGVHRLLGNLLPYTVEILWVKSCKLFGGSWVSVSAHCANFRCVYFRCIQCPKSILWPSFFPWNLN